MNTLLHAQLAHSAADVAFTVPIAPRGWARARKNGNRFFKDELTEAFERAVAMFALDAMRGKPLVNGPVELTVISIFAVPESWSRKQREAALAGTIRPTGKPDFDNLAKAAADALNGIVWIDDRQVVDGRSIKFYGAEAAVQIAVRAIDQPQSSGRPGGGERVGSGAVIGETA